MTEISAMDKMWISFIGIGLMVIAAVIITFARIKTKGVVKFILSLVAFILLLLGFIIGLLSIL